MPKGKGKKKPISTKEKKVPLKNEGEEYARVEKKLGDGRYTLKCYDGKERIGHIRGRIRRKARINRDDFVLVCLRSYQDDKCDIEHKYEFKDVKYLQSIKELPWEEIQEVEKEEEEDFFVEEEANDEGGGKEEWDPYAGIDDDDDEEE